MRSLLNTLLDMHRAEEICLLAGPVRRRNFVSRTHPGLFYSTLQRTVKEAQIILHIEHLLGARHCQTLCLQHLGVILLYRLVGKIL